MSKAKEKTSRKGTQDHSVGYRRPPRHTQWNKGQSGNKRGRPRKTAFEEPVFLLGWEETMPKIMAEQVLVPDPKTGRTRKYTLFEMCQRKAIQLAIAGDVSMLKTIFELAKRFKTERRRVYRISEREEQILAAFEKDAKTF